MAKKECLHFHKKMLRRVSKLDANLEPLLSLRAQQFRRQRQLGAKSKKFHRAAAAGGERVHYNSHAISARKNCIKNSCAATAAGKERAR